MLVRVLWRANRGGSAGCLRECLGDALGWACCTFGWKKEEQDTEAKLFDELVCKQFDEKRVVCARRCMVMMLVFLTMFSARDVMMIAVGVFDFVSLGQASVSSLLYLLSLGLVLFPSLTKAHTLHFWHFIFMLFPILWVSPLSGISVDNLGKTRAAIAIVSILNGIMNLNCRVSFFTYSVLSASAIHTIGIVDLQFMTIEIIMVFAQTALIYSLKTALYEATKRQLEAKSTRSQQAAVSSLLGMMCDSVVELGEDLKMVEHTPSLANALFHGSGTSLQGVPLENYITEEEDQEVFRRSMEVSNDELASAKAEMFHTRLRDAWGNLVQMEVFHVPFLGVDESMRHLIGLKEPTDAQPVAGPEGESAADAPVCPHATTPAGPEPARPAACLTNTIAAGLLEVSQSIAAGHTRSRSGRSGSASSSQRTDASDAWELQLDLIANLELAITFASPAFTARYGTSETIAELLPEPQGFSQWVNSIADDVFSGVQRPGVKEFASLTMHRGGGRGAGSSDSWCMKVNFPSPSRRNAAGEIAAPQRSMYKVGVRLRRKRHAGGGTSAVAQHQPLSARALGATSSDDPSPELLHVSL